MHYFLKFVLGKKFYMFRTVPLSIIRSFSLYTQKWCIHHTGLLKVCEQEQILLLASCCHGSAMTTDGSDKRE